MGEAYDLALLLEASRREWKKSLPPEEKVKPKDAGRVGWIHMSRTQHVGEKVRGSTSWSFWYHQRGPCKT